MGWRKSLSTSRAARRQPAPAAATSFPLQFRRTRSCRSERNASRDLLKASASCLPPDNALSCATSHPRRAMICTMRFRPRLVVLCFVALLSACVAPRPFEPRHPAQPQPQSPPDTTVQTQPVIPVEPPAPAQPLPAPNTRPRGLSAAGKALLAQAQAQSNAGNDSLAAATIERALRIDSDS